eukprot:scaffold110490_cov37-Prasinocladus_malaysianus.AAC.1
MQCNKSLNQDDHGRSAQNICPSLGGRQALNLRIYQSFSVFRECNVASSLQDLMVSAACEKHLVDIVFDGSSALPPQLAALRVLRNMYVTLQYSGCLRCVGNAVSGPMSCAIGDADERSGVKVLRD